MFDDRTPNLSDTTSSASEFGSDVIADTLRELGLRYLAINPGASFRGLHDSIVNRLGNGDPELILTLHEAQAVAMAHGYAKITDEPMGVILHANVGIMNAVMAIFDAYADRVPMIILGATGSVDAARRRPWIEWIHTSRDQGALVRNFIKWDDQPASVTAARESLLRANVMTRTSPSGPTYICLDVDVQEDPLTDAEKQRKFAPVERFVAPLPTNAAEADLENVLNLIKKAAKPVVLYGRNKRTDQAWKDRVALIDALGAAVICDQKCGVAFPSGHDLFVAAPAQYPNARTRQVINEADLIIAMDWMDLPGLLSLRDDCGHDVPTVFVSPDERLHNGWSFDHFPLAPAEARIAVMPETLTSQLLPKLRGHKPVTWNLPAAAPMELPKTGPVTVPSMARAIDQVRGNSEICFTRMGINYPEEFARFEGPLDSIGYDGGGGIGSTPGITVGAALALKGTGRLPICLLGDGDLLMGSQALWTAAVQKLPVLFIVNNNRAFFNDVEHQERVAVTRDREVKNKYVGMEIQDPAIDLVSLAGSYGLTTFGPVECVEDLVPVFEKAMKAARSGSTVLVDVSTIPWMPDITNSPASSQ